MTVWNGIAFGSAPPPNDGMRPTPHHEASYEARAGARVMPGVRHLHLIQGRQRFDMRKLAMLSFTLTFTFQLHGVFGQEVKNRAAEELKVMEAVYRYQIQQCSRDRKEMVLFVGLYDGKSEGNPPDALLERLKDSEPKVKKYSEMERSGKNNEFADKESGQLAALLSIDELQWKGDTEAEVQGSCGYAEWAAQGYAYTVVSDEEGWRVQGTKGTWVL